MNRYTAYSFLPRSTGKVSGKVAQASNQHIIDAVQSAVPVATSQVHKLAPSFKALSSHFTAKNIWNFLRNEIHYKADGEASQDIRLPSYFLETGIGDCKSYTLFASAILSSLDIPHRIRYASYTDNPAPSHVYVVLEDGTILDGTYSKFNEEKQYTHKRDYNMNVRQITGHGNQDVILGIGSFGSWLKDQWKKVTQPVKTGVLAAPRGAFLALLAVNFRGWSTIISKAPASLLDQIKLKWYNLGGNRTEFMNVVNKAKGKKPLFGSKVVSGISYPGIGVEPVTTGTLTATAATSIAVILPIILKVIEWLKQNNEPVDQFEDPNSSSGGDDVSTWDQRGDDWGGSGGPDDFTLPGSGSGVPTWALVAGGAALVYLLTKKK